MLLTNLTAADYYVGGEDYLLVAGGTLTIPDAVYAADDTVAAAVNALVAGSKASASSTPTPFPRGGVSSTGVLPDTAGADEGQGLLLDASLLPVWGDVATEAVTLASGKVTRTSGNVVTTSTSLVDVTGASITMTTGAHRVLLTATGAASLSSAGADIRFTFLVDGVNQGGTTGLVAIGNGANFDSNVSFSFLTDVLTAGSHTFKVQWSVSGGTGTIIAGATIPYVFAALETLAG